MHASSIACIFCVANAEGTSEIINDDCRFYLVDSGDRQSREKNTKKKLRETLKTLDRGEKSLKRKNFLTHFFDKAGRWHHPSLVEFSHERGEGVSAWRW